MCLWPAAVRGEDTLAAAATPPHLSRTWTVSAVGTRRGGLVQRSFVKKMVGATVQGRRLSAIQLTTAAGVVAVLEIFACGELPGGFVKQESITLERFLATQWGGKVYGDGTIEGAGEKR